MGRLTQSSLPPKQSDLEVIPEVLVVNLMMELHFWCLHEVAKSAGAAISGSLFQISVTGFHITAEQLCIPLGLAEAFQRIIDVVRKIALSGPQVRDV